MKKIYLIIGAALLAVMVVPKKINTLLRNVIDVISSDYNSDIEKVLARPEFKLSKTEKQIFFKRVVAIIAQESKGNKDVKNGSAGEVGIMQIKPKVAKSLSGLYPTLGYYDLKIPFDNILVGTLLLYDNYIKSKRDIDWATQRYNQGWVDKSNVKSLVYLAGVKGYEDYA